MKRFLFAAAVLALAHAASAADNPPHVITVSGHAEILVAPDRATIEIGVVTSAKTVSMAMATNRAEMTQVIAAIRSLGIEGKNIQTTSFAIGATHPRLPNGEEDESKTLGYGVTNKVTEIGRAHV